MVHTDLREIAEIFLKEGFDVLLPSYRGLADTTRTLYKVDANYRSRYAGSRGVPSEKGQKSHPTRLLCVTHRSLE